MRDFAVLPNRNTVGGIRRKTKKNIQRKYYFTNPTSYFRFHISPFCYRSAKKKKETSVKTLLKSFFRKFIESKKDFMFLFCLSWRRSKVSANQFSVHITRNNLMQRGKDFLTVFCDLLVTAVFEDKVWHALVEILA